MSFGRPAMLLLFSTCVYPTPHPEGEKPPERMNGPKIVRTDPGTIDIEGPGFSEPGVTFCSACRPMKVIGPHEVAIECVPVAAPCTGLEHYPGSAYSNKSCVQGVTTSPGLIDWRSDCSWKILDASME